MITIKPLSTDIHRETWSSNRNYEYYNYSGQHMVGSGIDKKRPIRKLPERLSSDETSQEYKGSYSIYKNKINAIQPNETPVELLSSDAEPKDMKNNSLIWSLYLRYQMSNCLIALSGLLILLFAILNSAVITVWPQYNVILNPQYWYEPLFPLCIGYILIASVGKNVQCYMVMKVSKIISLKSFAVIYAASIFGCVGTYGSIYMLWVYVLRKCHPMPFIGHCCTLAMWICNNIALWLLLSTCTKGGRRLSHKDIWIYISLAPIILMIGVFYAQFSSFLSKTPKTYQWCVGVLLPFIKKVSSIVTTKIAIKASQEESLSAKIAMIANVGSIHSFAVSLLMGSDISSTTAYVIMLLDSIPNILSFRTIVKLHRIGEKEKQMEELKCLALKELMEISIPVVYCISFVIAFYGPNAEILGNVKNDYWQYQKVEIVFDKLTNNAIFILVDAIRGAIIGLLLKRFCELNFLRTYCEIISSYGILVLVYVSGALAVVSIIIHYALLSLHYST